MEIEYGGRVLSRLCSMGLFLVVMGAFEEYTLEKLWVSALVYIFGLGLFDLSRAARASDPLIHSPLFFVIFNTEGHLFWRIGFGIMMVAVIFVGPCREGRLRAQMEDKRLRNAEQLLNPLLEDLKSAEQPLKPLLEDLQNRSK